MHVVTRLLGIIVLIMVATATLAFTPALRLPITADGFFTLRDLVAIVALPLVFTVVNYFLYAYLTSPLAGMSPSRNRRLAHLAAVVLVAGMVIAAFGTGVRFVGDELTTNYCPGGAESTAWCKRGDLFHREIGHLAIFVGNLLIGTALLVSQLCREVDECDRFNVAVLLLLGGVCGACLFAVVIEGRFIALGTLLVATYALATTVAWRIRRAEIRRLPVLGYQAVAVWVALTLIAAWGIYWRGFPGFTTLSALAIAK